MSIWKTVCKVAGLSFVLPAALAQQPAAPVVRVADLIYHSAFESYLRYSDEPVMSWKEANDRVGRIGGWRTYAKEASEQDTGAPAGFQSAPAVSPSAARPPAASSSVPSGVGAATPAAVPSRDVHKNH